MIIFSLPSGLYGLKYPVHEGNGWPSSHESSLLLGSWVLRVKKIYILSSNSNPIVDRIQKLGAYPGRTSVLAQLQYLIIRFFWPKCLIKVRRFPQNIAYTGEGHQNKFLSFFSSRIQMQKFDGPGDVCSYP